MTQSINCFIWQSGCQFSIDWAAWVQAFFTIVALAITQRIASGNDRNKRADILMAANTFAAQLISSIATLRQYSEQNRKADVLTHAFVLNEVLLLGRSIPIELLQNASAFTFFRLRAIAAETDALINEIRYVPDNTDITSFRDRFEALRVRAHDNSVSMNNNVFYQ